jgi:hypothetical protein
MTKNLTVFGVLLFALCSCETTAEEKFDHSRIPGIYESYTSVTYEVNDSIKVDFVPESYVKDGATYPVEIIESGNESYTLFFNHTDPRLPEQITVEIIRYEERNDPSGIMAYVKLLENSMYKLISGSFDDVIFYGKIYFHIELQNESTNDILNSRGYRDY